MSSSQCYWAECTNTFTLLICQRDVAFTTALASIAWYVRNVSNTNGLGSDTVQSVRIPHFGGYVLVSVNFHQATRRYMPDNWRLLNSYSLDVLSCISSVRGMRDANTRMLKWSLCPMAFFGKSNHAPALSVERTLYVFYFDHANL